MTDSPERDDGYQRANVQGDGNQTVQIVGSHNQVTLFGARALPLIEDVIGGEPKKNPEKRNAAGFTPTGYPETKILWATNRKSLKFRGREAEVSALWDWLTAEDKISAHIITGAGGCGKTRLAVELAAKARDDGWRAGFAGRDAFAPFNSDSSRWAWTKPTLIVVDYVAAKAEALKIALAALVNHHPPAQNAPKLRFLLLERSGTPESFWWRHLFGGTDHRDGPIADLLDPSHVIHLQGLAEEDRFAVFAEAYKLASDKPPPDRSAAWDQTLAQLSLGGEPLFLAMTGLVLARQGLGAKDELTADKLAFDLAGQEQKRIETHWTAAGLPKPQARSLPAHLAAVATLCGGLEEAAAHAMIAEESAALHQEIPSGNTDAAYTALYQALPADGGAIAPLLPDILGEALILRAFGRLPDKGSAALTRASHRARQAVFDTVIRCGRDFNIRGKSLPLDWLKQLHAESEGDLAALIELMDALPSDTVELRKIAVEITQSVVVTALALDDKAVLAPTLHNLSNRLADLGQRQKALDAAEESIKVFYELGAQKIKALKPLLATALNSLSNRRYELGQLPGALGAAEESVKIYLTLVTPSSEAFRPDLAGTLNNLSIMRAKLRKHKEALNAAEASVKIYNELNAENSEALRPKFAGALSNFSNHLNNSQRPYEALAAAERSVDIYRALIAQNLDAFRPDLVMALGALSNSRAALGEWPQSLDAAEESADHCRALFKQYPEAFRRALTTSLGRLARSLEKTGRPDDARAAIKEAITALSPVFLTHPDAEADLMGKLIKDYRAYCEATKTDPDETLLAPIIARFQSLSPGDTPDAT